MTINGDRCSPFQGQKFNAQDKFCLFGDLVGHPPGFDEDIAVTGAYRKTELHCWNLFSQGVIDVKAVHRLSYCLYGIDTRLRL